MNNRHVGIGVIVVLLAVSIGIVIALQADGSQNANNNNNLTDSKGNAENRASLKLDPNSSTLSSPESDPLRPSKNYHVNMTVRPKIFGYENLSYENVMLCVYDERGNVLHGESIGRISSPMRLPDTKYVNMTFDRAPKYFVVDHPEMRNDKRVSAEPIVWHNDTSEWDVLYNGFEAREDDFEWPRSSEVGTCG